MTAADLPRETLTVPHRPARARAPSRRPAAIVLIAAGVLGALVTGCRTGGADADAGAALGSTTTDVVVPAVHSGPQGDTAQFVVKCAFSHAGPDDPIVHPGHHGASHRHDFFGNTGTDSESTAASLVGGETSCTQRLDTAAYWAPSLIDHGEPVTPLGAIAYYRPAPGVDQTTLTPYPTGLKMVSGDPVAQEPQPVEIAGWACGTSSDVQSSPPVCPAAAPLRVRITFPDCWDGRNLDSADHRAHVTRSQQGTCPSSHPVLLPQLTLVVRYPISGDGHDLTLASGATITAHADFLNAWDEHELTDQVTMCLRRGLVCSVASNKAEDEPQDSPTSRAGS